MFDIQFDKQDESQELPGENYIQELSEQNDSQELQEPLYQHGKTSQG